MPTEKKSPSKAAGTKSSSTAPTTASKAAVAEKKTTTAQGSPEAAVKTPTKTAEPAKVAEGKAAAPAKETTSAKTNPAPAPQVQDFDFTPPSHEQIAQRAFFIWQERGFSHGADVQDWLRAEHELKSLARK